MELKKVKAISRGICCDSCQLEKTATKGKYDSVYVPPQYKDQKVYVLITEEIYKKAKGDKNK